MGCCQMVKKFVLKISQIKFSSQYQITLLVIAVSFLHQLMVFLKIKLSILGPMVQVSDLRETTLGRRVTIKSRNYYVGMTPVKMNCFLLKS